MISSKILERWRMYGSDIAWMWSPQSSKSYEYFGKVSHTFSYTCKSGEESLQFWLLMEWWYWRKSWEKEWRSWLKKCPLRSPLKTCLEFTLSLLFMENTRTNISVCCTIYVASVIYMLAYFIKHFYVKLAGYCFQHIM